MARIIIIDDDVDLAEDLSLMLTKEGITVELRDTTEGAVESLNREPPDLLILDVMFPENPSGGFDLAREIRKTPPISALPIILLTSINQEFPMDFSSEDIDPEWMPVQDFLEKPVDLTALLSKIQRLIGQASD